MDKITATKTNVVRSEIEKMAMKSSGVTVDHLKRAHEAENSFLQGISNIRDKDFHLK